MVTKPTFAVTLELINIFLLCSNFYVLEIFIVSTLHICNCFFHVLPGWYLFSAEVSALNLETLKMGKYDISVQ